jgi:hypothetical protein
MRSIRREEAHVTELVHASLQFPTVVFTIGLGIALVYWLAVLLGALDIDVLGHGHGHHDLGEVGLGAVPATISVSIVLLAGWCGSLIAMRTLEPTGALAALVLPGALIAALAVTAVAVRPLSPVFALREGKSNADYVGHTCTISTGRVDDGFGQATVEDGGTVLVIAVRCDRPSAFARGDRALIIEFDLARQAYVVEPCAELAIAP